MKDQKALEAELKELRSDLGMKLGALVEPARAAANQMQDAGMKAGAAPLLEALFQLDACTQKVRELLLEDPVATAEVLLKLWKPDTKD